MTLKSLVKQTVLLPLRPRIFRCALQAARMAGLLPKRAAGQWPPRRILVVNPTHTVGDAFIMLPLLDALHRALPLTAIDLIAEPPTCEALQAIPYMGRVFRFSPRAPQIPLLTSYFRVAAMLRFARRELRNQPYDLAILPRWGTDPYLLTYLAAMSAAPQLAGHHPDDEVTRDFHFPHMDALLTIVSRGGAGMAEAVRQMRVLLACGLVAEIDAEAEERRPVESIAAMSRSVHLPTCLARLGVSSADPVILLAPGASHAVRRWPAERFAALGTALHQGTGAAVWSIAGPADQTLCATIETLSHGTVRSLAGKTSVLETTALIAAAALLVTNDSGPGHIGAGAGTPTLVLSACPATSSWEHSNSPLRIRPVGPRVVVLQPRQPAAPCGERCIRTSAHCILGIDVDAAVQQASSLYNQGRNNPTRHTVEANNSPLAGQLP